MTMMILSNFIAQKTLAWTSIHSWVTNSTIEDLLYRLLFFASDLYNINYIHQNNVRLIPDNGINADRFIHMQGGLMNDWRTVARAFNALNRDLKELKYSPNASDPNYRPGPNPIHDILKAKEVLVFEGHELKSDFMPMPVLGVLCPIFR